ncbi:MAG: cytochrome d ubiquinol oxidase subunit II, partial [Actinomycetota bacterium]|nr:cytochrome d ubiquinol oxidase subunit II [Actinomycetota bacterium]
MTLAILWFWIIAALWGGYFLLEGFDFGVGILLPFLGRRQDERRVLLDTIAPVWDGNEVWLVIAAGATFAAFPAWYATMFSGFYLLLLLVLVLLIVRAVSFEWRGRSAGPRSRGAWQWANTIGSFGAPFIWGLVLANLLHGVPLDGKGHFSGSLGDLFSAYTVLAGLATVGLFALHGATFLTLRTTGASLERATRAARRLSIPVTIV